MIIVRNVFQAKYGKGDELVSLFKEMGQRAGSQQFRQRILTDQSGLFFTVVSEMEMESLAAWERFTREGFADPQFAAWFERMVPLVESGHREFYRVEE